MTIPELPMAKLRQQGERIFYKAGQILFHEGQRDNRMLLIESGTVDIGSATHNGGRLSFNVLSRGDIFGEVSMIDEGPRTAEAIAVTDVVVVALRKAHFCASFPTEADAWQALALLMAHRIRWINDHSEHNPLQSSKSLVVSKILLLDANRDNSWVSASQQTLASASGITREHTNRVLQELKSEGLIELRRGGYRVKSYRAMTKMLENLLS